MQVYRCAIIAVLLGCLMPATWAADCYRSSLKAPVPFLGNQGEELTLADGTKWRVKTGFAYLKEFYSQVTICPSEERLLLKGRSLSVERVGGRRARQPAKSGLPKPRVILKAHIDGEFNGWNGGSVFRLDNGQVWQQLDYSTGFLQQNKPVVTIFARGKLLEMQIENLPNRIAVKRIQ